VDNENTYNVSTGKRNDYVVATVYEIQDFSVTFEMFLKFCKKLVSRPVG
jgi:hypothetical protein